MRTSLTVLVACLAAGVALADDPVPGKPADSAAPPAAAAKEFKPPPGFKTKKRGALTVYCKKDREVGTRFVTEKCLDEAQMRDYLLAMEEQKRDIDRIRSTCANAAVCANQ
jgi:hypothetical protein